MSLNHNEVRGTICTLIDTLGRTVCGAVAIARWNLHDRQWHIQCQGQHEKGVILKPSLQGRYKWMVTA